MSRKPKWLAPALWMAFFFWLDCFPFRGYAAWLAFPNFTLAFLLVATFYYEGGAALGLALGAGVAADAITGAPVHTVAYVAIYYAAWLIKGIFYRPGSPFHVMSYLLFAVGANVFLYAATSVGELVAGIPALFLLECGAVDFAVFLLMLVVFRRYERPTMYKMTR